MTREIAIDNLKADIKYWENTSVSTEHLCMAVKALEQESVLDEIRAEIETWHKEGTNWSDIRLMNIENIIDKYKKSDEWVNFADDLIPIIDEAESEEVCQN